MSSSRGNSSGKASYSLASARRFLKDLRDLDNASNRRIIQTVELLKENPYLGKRLRGQLSGFYSLRVGDFRVIYTIQETTRTVTLHAVGQRKAIYTA